MKYNIAILDDQKEFFEEYKDTIDTHLKEHGFIAVIDYIQSESEFDQYDLDKPDLFMIDLKFGIEDKGQKFIEKIRDNYFTDILFYSSDHEAIESYRKNAEMQGIFFAEKDEQNDEVEILLIRLLDKMLLKANAPRSMRGIVMECVAELDDIIKQKISALESKIPVSQKENVRKKILKHYKDSNDGRNKKLFDFFATPFVGDKVDAEEIYKNAKSFSVTDLIDNIQVTDSQKNLQCLLILYKELYRKDELYSQIKKYEELLSKRNILAHVTQEKRENGYAFKHHTDISEYYELTLEEALSLRKIIIKLEDHLKKIA
ncbi:MAG: hypothetical protein K2O94_01195 [Clostridiales bacterium]|nr:hypothetical protein [Clostridiales bacterium]